LLFYNLNSQKKNGVIFQFPKLNTVEFDLSYINIFQTNKFRKLNKTGKLLEQRNNSSEIEVGIKMSFLKKTGGEYYFIYFFHIPYKFIMETLPNKFFTKFEIVYSKKVQGL